MLSGRLRKDGLDGDIGPWKRICESFKCAILPLLSLFRPCSTICESAVSSQPPCLLLAVKFLFPDGHLPLWNCKLNKHFLLEVALVMVFCHNNRKGTNTNTSHRQANAARSQLHEVSNRQSPRSRD